MVIALKLMAVGYDADAVGIILPLEVRERLGVRLGDPLYLTPAPGNSYRITANDPDFAEQMAAVERVMREDSDVLRELSKR